MYNAYDFIQIMFRDQRLPQREQQQREFEDRVARKSQQICSKCPRARRLTSRTVNVIAKIIRRSVENSHLVNDIRTSFDLILQEKRDPYIDPLIAGP